MGSGTAGRVCDILERRFVGKTQQSNKIGDKMKKIIISGLILFVFSNTISAQDWYTNSEKAQETSTKEKK